MTETAKRWGADRPLRIAVVGAAGVGLLLPTSKLPLGKTSLAARRVNDTFDEEYKPTTEDETLETNWHDSMSGWSDSPIPVMPVKIIDSGTEDLREASILDCEGFILAFSLTDSASFDAIHGFVDKILQIKGVPKVPMGFVGCKADLESERTVTMDHIGPLCGEFETPVFETSAKTGTQVNDCFEDLCRKIISARVD